MAYEHPTYNGAAIITKTSKIFNQLPYCKNLFIRIHRSFIVSIDKISAFTNYDVEIGKIEIPIGRQYAGVIKVLK